MATDPTTNTLRQAAEAAAREVESTLPRNGITAVSHEKRTAIILRHVAPALEQVEAQAAGMRGVLSLIRPDYQSHALDCSARFNETEGTHYRCRCLHSLTLSEIDAALAPDAGSALLARLAAAEKVVTVANDYYNGDITSNALHEALAAYRKLCPAEVK